MSELDIKRWADTITPRDKAPLPWAIGSGGSWDMLQVQPIPDEMLEELAHRYRSCGTPWNCRSLPLSAADREYMYLLYYCMQGMVARILDSERRLAEALLTNTQLRAHERRLDAMLPLFQEARDALPAIPLAAAKLRNLRLDIADRMDDVGIPERWKAIDAKAQAAGSGGKA